MIVKADVIEFLYSFRLEIKLPHDDNKKGPLISCFMIIVSSYCWFDSVFVVFYPKKSYTL